LTGTIHYSGKHRVDSTGLKGLRGSGVVDAGGHYRSPRGEELPLDVTLDLSVEGEAARLLNGSLRAGSTRASFSGRWARGEGLVLKMTGGTGNLSEILPLFAPLEKNAQHRNSREQPPGAHGPRNPAAPHGPAPPHPPAAPSGSAPPPAPASR